MSSAGRRAVLVLLVLMVLLGIGFHYGDKMLEGQIGASASSGRENKDEVKVSGHRQRRPPTGLQNSDEALVEGSRLKVEDEIAVGAASSRGGEEKKKKSQIDFELTLVDDFERKVLAAAAAKPATLFLSKPEQEAFCRNVLEMAKTESEGFTQDQMLQIPSIRNYPRSSPLYRSMQLFAILFPSVENITLSAPSSSSSFSCASAMMDHLFEWAYHSIGTELRNLQSKNEGIFYLSHRGMCRSRGVGGHWRFGWFPQELAQRVAAAKHYNFTMMYLSIHDADLWTIASDSHGGMRLINETLEKYPNAFLIHPSGRTDAHGHLYRTVPIPHAPSEIVFIDFPSIRIPYEKRNIRKVAWRGSTTGEYQRPYSRTDRYRTVQAFQSLNREGLADVAFSGIAQGNDPGSPIGTQLDRKQIMHHQVTLDVDGNSNSWEGLRWKLMAGAAVVKVRSGLGFVQWYYHRLRNGEELIETDVEHVVRESMRVLDNATLGAHLAKQALAFGEKYLTPAAVDEAVWDLVGNVWRYGYDFEKDWRIQHGRTSNV